jgi:hypothetical protein
MMNRIDLDWFAACFMDRVGACWPDLRGRDPPIGGELLRR